MNGNLARKRRLRQCGKSYEPEVDGALWIIAESLDHICAERLTPNLGEYITPQDGHDKQDCKQAAIKRWVKRDIDKHQDLVWLQEYPLARSTAPCYNKDRIPLICSVLAVV